MTEEERRQRFAEVRKAAENLSQSEREEVSRQRMEAAARREQERFDKYMAMNEQQRRAYCLKMAEEEAKRAIEREAQLSRAGGQPGSSSTRSDSIRRPAAAVRVTADEDAAAPAMPRLSNACNSRKCVSTTRRRNSGRSGPSCERKWQESLASRMLFARNKACRRFPYRASDVFSCSFKTGLPSCESPPDGLQSAHGFFPA